MRPRLSSGTLRGLSSEWLWRGGVVVGVPAYRYGYHGGYGYHGYHYGRGYHYGVHGGYHYHYHYH